MRKMALEEYDPLSKDCAQILVDFARLLLDDNFLTIVQQGLPAFGREGAACSVPEMARSSYPRFFVRISQFLFGLGGSAHKSLT